MTTKLFYNDPYQFEFTARVIECNAQNGLSEVILDQTCFYPGGGGQPADRGILNDISVLELKEENGIIKHYLPTPPLGIEVRGKIDEQRRLDFMQQHTGQHIISAALQKVASCETVSVHLGEDYTAVELNCSEITPDLIQDAENLANEIITQNLPVIVHYITPDELKQFPIRKIGNASGRIRIIEIEGFDYSGCGGTHLKRTGEVLLIKFIGQEKIRKRVRLHFKIGDRALADYREKHHIVTALNRELTCSTDEILDSINKLKNRIKEQHRQIQELQNELLPFLANRLYQEASNYRGTRLIFHIFEDKDMSWLKSLAYYLRSRFNKNIFLFLNKSSDNEKTKWVFGKSEDVQVNLRERIESLLPLIEGKGGGNNSFLMGGAKRKENLNQFLVAAKNELIKELENE